MYKTKGLLGAKVLAYFFYFDSVKIFFESFEIINNLVDNQKNTVLKFQAIV